VQHKLERQLERETALYNTSENDCGALTSSLLTVGTGVTGDATEPIPSQNVYSAQSVLMIVHEAPSFIVSFDEPFGDAFKHTQ